LTVIFGVNNFLKNDTLTSLGKTENKASTLILAVGGYVAYKLLVANITNAVSCVLHLPLTSTTVFAVALAVATGIMLPRKEVYRRVACR
jgi:hypothetical protein